MRFPIRRLMLVVILVAACYTPAGFVGFALARTNCEIVGVSFATCTKTARHFRSIIVAIPGWNGVCKDSFGEGAGNVLNVMRQAGFFDVECFDYDSHDTPLAETEEQLRTLLSDLQELGYEEVSFVTHSTGGVLLLDLLLKELRTADGTAIRLGPDRSILFRSRDGLRLKAVYAWGMPINGVGPAECVGGWFANLFGFSTAVLPHLCEDSPFLQQLKADYVSLNSLLNQLSPDERYSLQYQLMLFHGQGADWVVNNIEPGEPWFPVNGQTRIVDSQGAHTRIIRVNGEVDYPTFAGLAMTDAALLAFSLLPRTDEFFRADVVASETLSNGQQAILDGVVDFASFSNLFQAGSAEVSAFTVRLFNGRFVRDPKFDAMAVDRLDRLLRQKVGHQLGAVDAVRYGDSLLSDIEFGYRKPNPDDKLLFGGQSRDAVEKLVSAVAFVFSSVRDLVVGNPDLEQHLLTSSRSLPIFEGKVGSVLGRLIEDRDPEIRLAAFRLFREFAREASEQAIASIDFDQTLGQFGRANYFLITAEEKEAFGDVLTSYSARSPLARQQVMTFLTEQQTWLNEEAPMWAPLLNDTQMRELLRSDNSDVSVQYMPEFLRQVISDAGRFGQEYTLATEAVELYRPYLLTTDPQLNERNRTLFTDGIRESQYPIVQQNGLELMRDLNIDATGITVGR